MKKRTIQPFVILLSLLALLNFISAGTLRVTEEHPFLINGEWIDARDLKIGDELTLANGSVVTIKNIKSVESEEPFPVYNLEAGEYHNFIVCGEEDCNNESVGVVVHNSNKMKGIFYKQLTEGVDLQFIRDNVVSIHVNSKFNLRRDKSLLLKFLKDNPGYQFEMHTPNPALISYLERYHLANFKRLGYKISNMEYFPPHAEKVTYRVKSYLNKKYLFGDKWRQLIITPPEFKPGKLAKGSIVSPRVMNFGLRGAELSLSRVGIVIGILMKSSWEKYQSLESYKCQINLPAEERNLMNLVIFQQCNTHLDCKFELSNVERICKNNEEFESFYNLIGSYNEIIENTNCIPIPTPSKCTYYFSKNNT